LPSPRSARSTGRALRRERHDRADRHDRELRHDCDPIVSAERQEAKQRFRKAFARLSKQEREVAVLLYVEEWTLRDIGDRLGVSESRVSQIHTGSCAGAYYGVEQLSILSKQMELPLFTDEARSADARG
jgi:RNA polymerase sigma factor (sigma-70 family)